MTQFLPAWIFSVFMLIYGIAQITSVCVLTLVSFQTGVLGVKGESNKFEKGGTRHEDATWHKKWMHASSPCVTHGGVA
jgi:hypothetical protein